MIINYTVRRKRKKKSKINKARYSRMTQSWKNQKRRKKIRPMKQKKGMVLQRKRQITSQHLKIKRLNHLTTKVKQSKNRLNLNMELRTTIIVKIIITSKLISHLMMQLNHIPQMLKVEYLCQCLLQLDGIPEEISTIRFHLRILSANSQNTNLQNMNDYTYPTLTNYQ